MSPAMRHWLKDQRPFKKVKSKRRNIGGDTMAFFSVPSKHLLVPPAPTRKINQRISGRPKGDIDDFLSSDVERELERSFASTMSIHSPTRNSISSASENENADYVPMDISPAPPRVQPSKSAFLEPKPTGRPRAHTTSARLFGRDMSNASIGSTSGLSLIPSASPGTTSGDKKLQRAALPLEWMMTARPAQPSKNLFAQASHRSGFDQFPGPHDAPSSPAMSDAMDVDTSYIPSSARQQLVPLSAVPTITTFNLNSPTLTVGPLSAAPTVTSFKQLFYDNMSPVRAERGRGDYEESVSGFTVDESPAQPCHKKRRSVSPEREEIQRNHHVLDIDSSPAPLSSPSELKLERISSGSGQSHFKKPLLSGLGAPIALNANNKRPRRPVHSAMLPPGDSPLASHVVFPTDGRNKENLAERRPSRPVLPPVRRAFSAMLPPTPMEHSMSSEDGSFEQDGPDMSSPAQAYAKRQQVKTIRRCDGTDDFRPSGGVTALVQRDNAVMKRGLRRSEERTERIAERDTPRSMYLHSNGLGGFGDNEAHGKILPCHRVKSDGLMRITSKTLNDLLDGAFDSQIENFHVIDCRFNFEHKGGHVPGAINLREPAEVENFLLGKHVKKPAPSTSGDASKKTVIVFHCEFSLQRAPTFAKQLRNTDRYVNSQLYPKIHYPEVYILEGGYYQYFRECQGRCEPRDYICMNHPAFAEQRKEEMEQLRRNAKSNRTKPHSYGESKGGLVDELRQPNRNTAPVAGSSQLFAAGNAARTRRNGILATLDEDPSHIMQSDDDDTDIGDSPCPPPTKGVGLKKLGRARALTRVETAPSRVHLGF